MGFGAASLVGVDDERPENAAAAEKALAHDGANKVAAAYRGSDLLARRRALMAAWSELIAPVDAPAVMVKPAKRKS